MEGCKVKHSTPQSSPENIAPSKTVVEKPTNASEAPKKRRKRAALNKTPEEKAVLRASATEAQRARRKHAQEESDSRVEQFTWQYAAFESSCKEAN